MKGLKFSIITVCYNSGRQISDAIESVVNQGYDSIEYIIIDGGSSDETLDIVNKHKDDIDVVVSEKDDGIYDAMNKGISNATGDIVGILNSDDYYVDERVVEKVSLAFENNPDIDVVLCGVEFVDSRNLSIVRRTYKSVGFKLWMLYAGIMPPHPGVFVRKSMLNQVGNYRVDFKIASDFDYMLRLLIGAKAKYLIKDDIVVRMREGGISTSGLASNLLSTKEMHEALKSNGLISSYLLLALRLPYKYVTQIFGVRR